MFLFAKIVINSGIYKQFCIFRSIKSSEVDDANAKILAVL